MRPNWPRMLRPAYSHGVQVSFCMYQYMCILNTSPTTYQSIRTTSITSCILCAIQSPTAFLITAARKGHERSSFRSLQLGIVRWRRSHVANNMRSCKKTDVGAGITNTVEYVLVSYLDLVNYVLVLVRSMYTICTCMICTLHT